ncbi:hypothetical protein [Candidatus Enterococcus leclercqii]|uniref:hypothetical protein n=1 Tax=Candidatus Enterococcus leclercqii TaxID=1857218 RepID=UPI00192A5283|nr:hypothetical protein [Enterococcus sp. CU9D]KAF1290893.1 hypothetical protein BAU14_08990 [Enterococcus sp. CU9D]
MKKWFVGLVLPLMVFFLAACSNDLSIKLDETEATANNDGTVAIKGKVDGKGTLYINDLKAESQPSKDGSFNTVFGTTGYEDTTLHVNYIDDEDKENRTSTDFKVKANAEAVEKKKEADAKAKKEAEEEAARAKAAEEAAKKKAEEEAKKQAEEEAKQKAAEEAAKKKAAEEVKQKEDAINAAFEEIISVGSGFIVKIEPIDATEPLEDRGYKAYIVDDVKYENENVRHQFIDNLAMAIQNKVSEQTGDIPYLTIAYINSGRTAASSGILDRSVMKYKE